jgi:cytochrome c oxidase subunit 2
MPPAVRRKLFVLVLVLGAALTVAAVAHAGNAGFAPETPHSPNAGRINSAYKLIGLFTGLIFILVESALLWFVFRYRRRGRAREVEGPQIHGATRLELIWTAVPVLILAVIVAFVLYELPGIRHVPKASAGDPPLRIRVDGHQFYWQFTYPNGHVSIQELHVPAHRVVSLTIHSQDVDHSWWIPELGGKFDAIPGITNHTWFEADRPGTYVGQCGEFCGVFHAEMVARVVAEPSQSAYNAYVANLANPLTLGGQEWRGVCATCHGMQGQGGYGPPIATNQILVQPGTLESIVRNGQNILKPISSYMPPVGRNWTTFQLKALEQYLKQHVYKGSASGH